MLAEMDRTGIEVAILSMSSPGVSMLGGTRAQIRTLARACNEYAAALRREHPGRLGHFRRDAVARSLTEPSQKPPMRSTC